MSDCPDCKLPLSATSHKSQLEQGIPHRQVTNASANSEPRSSDSRFEVVLFDSNMHGNLSTFEHVDFSGCDLRGFDFSGRAFYACDFIGTDLRGTNFRECTFGTKSYNPEGPSRRAQGLPAESQFESGDTFGCRFDGAMLEAVDFCHSRHSYSEFRNSSINGAKFDDARFEKSRLKNVTVRNVNFKNTTFANDSSFWECLFDQCAFMGGHIGPNIDGQWVRTPKKVGSVWDVEFRASHFSQHILHSHTVNVLFTNCRFDTECVLRGAISLHNCRIQNSTLHGNRGVICMAESTVSGVQIHRAKKVIFPTLSSEESLLVDDATLICPDEGLARGIEKKKNMRRFDFRSQVIAEMDFSGIDCSEIDFTGCRMTNVDFSGAKLVGAVFRDSRLWNVNFSDSDLTGADFGNAYLQVTLDGAVVSRAQFLGTCVVGESTAKGAKFEAANFADCHLILFCEPSDLTGAIGLDGAVFQVENYRTRVRRHNQNTSDNLQFKWQKHQALIEQLLS